MLVIAGNFFFLSTISKGFWMAYNNSQ